MMMKKSKNSRIENVITEAERLREKLHKIPEPSGLEVKTKQLLMDYLQPKRDNAAETAETAFAEGIRTELTDEGKWFYLAHREPEAAETLAFRADMDAVTGPDGRPYHGCGHDGHSSVMAALAKAMEGEKCGKNLIFLFQHAEETGEGAEECLRLFEKEKIHRMYAFHNIPGYPKGELLYREDTFACASRGLVLKLAGKQSHAAYPELGRNPIFPMGELISRLPALTKAENFKGMTLLTPIFVDAGARAFGVAAGEGEMGFTLRAWYDEDLKLLEENVLKEAEKLAADAGITLSWHEQDVFAACANDLQALKELKGAAEAAGIPAQLLSEPMRWSEDFGRFCTGTKACIAGIGAGETAAGLHTPQYCWNSSVTEAAVRLFYERIYY